ncbi:MAG TPA: 50S ribosomal protein L11 methyltransferase [Desulfobulbaceae bacterium]|nr:50S ribosomal protein L11 methyltransferase [Desulfobulbaceae bacterium]
MDEIGNGGRGNTWLKISLQAPATLVEPVSDLMAVLSGSGVEISPETAEGTRISGFFPCAGDRESGPEITRVVQGKMEDLFALYELSAPELHSETFDDQDWATSWKRFFTPVEIVPGLVIRPSWEEYQAQEGERVIVMDPGQAFGTGQHASTRMALSLLTRSLTRHPVDRMLDVGTGTGILAMAAALYDVRLVVAIDNDPEAVRVAEENSIINKVAGAVMVSGTDLTDVKGKFSMITANIVHDVLVAMAPHLQKLLAPKGRVVLAGILKGEQEKNCIRIYEGLGLQVLESMHEEEWAALLLQRTTR